MITPDGWFDFAIRMPGPANKVWPEQNAIAGVVLHSAVGSQQGVIDRVMSTAQVSVTGTIAYDGSFVQFYPVTASPWANGSHEHNIDFLGFEHEGGVDTPSTVHEPLTPEQVATDIRILQDLAAYKGIGVDYWQRPSTLIEHREIYATACPSGRIPWDSILAGLAPPPSPPSAPYNVRMDGTMHLSDGSSYPFTATFDPPPGA